MLNTQDYFDKQLFKLDRELDDLYRLRRVRVPLDEPIQRGWRRFHVLTDKASKRPDKEVLLVLLKIIGSMKIRNSPDFRKKRGSGRWRRFIEIEQPLREITLGEWDRRRLPEAWKLYFRQEKRCHFRVWHDALIFANPEIFELKVEPNFITEMTLCDPVIEERIAEIKDKLWQGNAICRLDWLYGYSRPTRDSIRQKIFDKIAKSELREAISMEVDLGVFMECIQIRLQRSKSILSHGYC